MKKTIKEIKVRGYHLDLYKHVNNARYLELLEEGRWNHIDHIDSRFFEDRGIGFAVVNININYRYPATIGDVLEIHSHIERVGGKSVTFHQAIFLKGTDTRVVDATVTFVMIDSTGKALGIDDELRGFLEQ